MTKVVYLCDGRGCESSPKNFLGECIRQECYHTSNLDHAVNFEKIGGVYREKFSFQLEDIRSALFYNGLEEVVAKWAELKESNGRIDCPENYGLEDEYEGHILEGHSPEYYQLQIIWMLCVLMFGDYGTSPRSGWIDHTEEFREFCRKMEIEEV